MFEKFLTIAAELGTRSAILYCLDRAFVRCRTGLRLYRYILVAQPVPGDSILGERRAQSITVRPIGRSDAALMAMPLSETVIEHRFRQPVVCLGAFKGEELIAYLWLCLGPYEEDEVRCLFAPAPKDKAVWDFDVYVFPKYRLGLTFARLWDETNAFLRTRGVSWSISRISAFNKGSILSHRRLGARNLAVATFVRWRRAQLMVSSLPPYVHFGIGDQSSPTIQLAAPQKHSEGNSVVNDRLATFES